MSSKDELRSVGNKPFFWNIVGSVTNATLTMLITIVATRVAGVEEGGVLGVAIGLGQIFATCANYVVRAYQSTDLKEQFRFADYLGLRILTCLFTIIVCAWYVFGMKYTGAKASVVYAICIFKISDAFADVFHGYFQQHGHLEYAGQAVTLRIISVELVYSLTLILTHDPVLAAWMMPVVSILCLILFEISRIRRFVDRVRPIFKPAVFRKMLIACFPLFVSGFMNLSTLNITKIEVDSQIPQLQGYWTPIYMPASVINLLGNFAFLPMVTTLRFHWENNRLKTFIKLLMLLCGWIAVCLVCVLVGGYLLGIPALELVYGLPLAEYKAALLIVLVGGGFNALNALLYYVITIIRVQQFLLLGDGVTYLVSMIITPLLVRDSQLMGAAVAYLCSMLTRTIVFGLIILVKYLTSASRKQENG